MERFLLSIWEDSARNEEDKVLWTETKSNKFTIKSLYNALETGISVFFPMKIIWNPWVQPKVSFFAWKATWEKAPTLDKIQKRRQSLANRCYLCQMDEESIDHILHYVRIRAL